MATPPSKSNTPETAVPASVEQQLAALSQRVSVLEQAELARAAAPAAPKDAPVGKLGKKPVPPEFQGTKTYVVGPKKAYRDGRVYEAGEKITVTNERPASDWVPFNAEAPAQPTAAPLVKRAADLDVG